MAAVGSRQRAGLLAAAFGQTLLPVAEPFAAVRFTGQQLITRQTAGNVLQMAWDVAALLRIKGNEQSLTFPSIISLKCIISAGHYLMLSHAPLLNEVGAGGAFVLAVAIVKH